MKPRRCVLLLNPGIVHGKAIPFRITMHTEISLYGDYLADLN